MGHVGKTVTQNIVSGSEITDGTVTGDDLASDIAITTTGDTSLKGNVVINEDSADKDFRVESNGNANMLFVDGGNNGVGIGTSSVDTASTLTVSNTSDAHGITIVGAVNKSRMQFQGANTGSASTDGFIIGLSSSDDTNDDSALIGLKESGSMSFQTGGTTKLQISSAGTTTFTSSSHGNGEINFYNNAMYVKSNTGEVYATDNAGNHSLLSPHSFKYIPDGKSSDNAWSYLSEKTTPIKETVTETIDGKKVTKEVEKIERKDGDNFTYVNVDMMKVVREVEKLTGTKLIYTGNQDGDDGFTVKDDIIAGLIKRIEALEKA